MSRYNYKERIKAGLCTSCSSKITRNNGKHCEDCYEKLRIYGRNIRNRLTKNNICVRCKKRKASKNFTRCRKCRQNHKQLNISIYLSTKLLVLDAYGGRKCSCCGESEISFLVVDHIYDDGGKFRKANPYVATGHKFYRWLVKNNFPKNLNLQILCANCNHSKAISGVCVHKRHSQIR